MKITANRIIKEFKTVIVPEMFGKPFYEVDFLKSTTMFMKYIDRLLEENLIDRDMATTVEFKFVKKLSKTEEFDNPVDFEVEA